MQHWRGGHVKWTCKWYKIETKMCWKHPPMNSVD